MFRGWERYIQIRFRENWEFSTVKGWYQVQWDPKSKAWQEIDRPSSTTFNGWVQDWGWLLWSGRPSKKQGISVRIRVSGANCIPRSIHVRRSWNGWTSTSVCKWPQMIFLQGSNYQFSSLHMKKNLITQLLKEEERGGRGQGKVGREGED